MVRHFMTRLRVLQLTILCIFQLFCLNTSVYAQTYNYNTTEASSIVPALVLKTYGTLPYNITVWNNDWGTMVSHSNWRSFFKFKSNNSFVKFSVDHYYFKLTDSAYTYMLTYQLTGYTSPDTSTSTVINDTLKISYNPDSLSAFQDIQLKKYSGFYKIQVSLTGLYDITNPAIAPVAMTISTLKRLNFNIEASILTQRYDLKIGSLSGSGTVAYGSGSSLYNAWDASHILDNYLAVSFNESGLNLPTPVSYELEWAYVDDYRRNIRSDSMWRASTSELSFDFLHNSTRIWVDTPYYRIPLVYPRGYIVMRARMMRPDSSLYQFPIYSAWTYSVPDSGNIAGLSSTNSYYSIDSAYGKDSVNWQYTISFAEGGKYKHVLSFYDGLLKNRESITRFNSSLNKLIVTQNIYDFEGRPAIKILPTPVDNTNFSYQYNVSLNSATSAPYKAADFDTVRLLSCPSEALLSPLAATSLASKYYSKYNPDTSSGLQMYVPDAGGYPLVQTIYEPGFNDRVQKQGGAGSHLQIADSNIIENEYVGATQQDLNILFGGNIGWAGFYNKTVSKDPNRQLSLSVKDFKGKQVMTTMVGTGPSSLTHAIVANDNVPGATYFEEDLIAGMPQRVIGDNKILDKDFFIEADGNDTIQYIYSYVPYPTPCDSAYLSVKASYYYTAIDQCGNLQISKSGTLGTTGVVKVATPVPFTGNRDYAFLAKGRYQLHKVLTIDPNDVYVAVDSFMNGKNCLYDQPHFVRQSVEATNFPCPNVDSNDCASLKQEMIDELYPDHKYGKYFIYSTSPNIIDCHDDSASIFSNSDKLHYRYQKSCLTLPDSAVDAYGNVYHNLSTIDPWTFITVFNNDIATALLPLHPEYCKLQGCYLDTFKTQVLAIPDAVSAGNLNLLLLDSIVAKDPIKSVLTSGLGYANPADSLKTFKGGILRLDTMAMLKAYCGCTDSIMLIDCMNHLFGKQINMRLLTNDFVKNSYWSDVTDLYFKNRERMKSMLTSNLNNHCGPCDSARMKLIPLPLIPSYYDSTGSIDPHSSLWSSFGTDTAGLMHSFISAIDSGITLSKDSISKLRDSTRGVYSSTDSVLCVGQIDTILERLSNCIAYSTTLKTALRTTLDSLCTANAVQYGDFTPDQIQYVLARNGLSPGDLCNPYLVEYNRMTPAFPSAGNCKDQSFFDNIKTFLNKPVPLSSLISAATTSPSSVSGYKLNTAFSAFEDSMYTILTSDTVKVYATYKSSSNLYTLFITPALAVGDTIRINIRGADTISACHNIFKNVGGSDSSSVLSISCINNQPQQITVGLIGDFTFVANVFHSSGMTYNNCTLIGWADSVATMNFDANPLNGCVTCKQFRTLFTQFMDSMTVWNVKGTDHPLYQTMLGNFMNYKLGKIYSNADYSIFLQSCALADSVKLKQYVAYSTLIFNDSAAVERFIDSVNAISPLVYITPRKDDSLSGGTPVIKVQVNLNAVPLDIMYKFVALFNRYTDHITSKLVNTPFPTLEDVNALGIIYTPKGKSFIPNATAIFGSGTAVTLNGPRTIKVWNGRSYFSDTFYTILEPGGVSAWQVSRDVYAMNAYIINNSLYATSFMPNYQSTINPDYYKPEKQAYLAYTYSLNNLPDYQVLDSIQELNLMSGRVPIFDTETVSYTKPFNPNIISNLYVAKTSGANGLYDTLRKVLSLTAAHGTAGQIFFDPNTTNITTGLNAYRCGDGSYWYRYFGPKDTMYNVYVHMPAYIPRYMHKSYLLDSIYAVPPPHVNLMPGDSTSRFFVLVLKNGTARIKVYGMTDFVIGKNIELDNVLLASDNMSSDALPTLDTFNNCERSKLKSAVRMGIITYHRYIDSIRLALDNGFMDYMMKGVREKMILGYRDQEFNTTLYYYDRAGNLTSTVPPQGVVQLNTTKLGKVDSARTSDTTYGDIFPAHKKISSYSYDSRNEVIAQQTPDGGKTVFMYDAAGRLVLSQNAKQKQTGAGTYNLYDNQGRIIETGQTSIARLCPTGGGVIQYDNITFPHPMPCDSVPGLCTGYVWMYMNPDGTVTYSPYMGWVYNLINETNQDIINAVQSQPRTDVVMTIYDTATKDLKNYTDLTQQTNLRKRIACVKYFSNLDGGDRYFTGYDFATHYSYDVDGNVNTLVQDFNHHLDSFKQRYKRIDYNYDLVSGKVNMLSYNRSHADQYYQRYTYDADNRITQVETSNDGYIWQRDAGYSYYDHGPLARVSVGDLRVQGIDYAYTIQGWLKAINGDTLSSAYDMGGDGSTTTVYAADVTAGTIDYFSGDYKPIAQGKKVEHISNPTLNLYNGNIARQTVAITPFQRLEKQYIYDQLNRINSTSYGSIDAASNTITGLNDYFNRYKYDQDGNITKLIRYGNKTGTPTPAVALMDSFTYFYPKTTVNNQLQDITDSATDVTGYKNDIKHYTDTGKSRYMYDAIGNTTKDLVSGQDSIYWNLYNKVTQASDTAKKTQIQFSYDGAGNRVGKYVYVNTDSGSTEDDDFYIRDAQGNILAVYNMNRAYKVQYVKYQLPLIAHITGDLRSSTGTTDHNFNHNFTNPVFGHDPGFTKALLNYSVVSGGQTNFAGTAMSGKTVAYYMTHSSAIYNNMVLSGAGYVFSLAAFERAHPDSVLAPAIMSVFNTNDYITGSHYISALLSDTSLAMRKRVLHLMNNTGNDSLIMALASAYNSPVLGTADSTADALLPNLPASSYAIFNTLRSLKDSMYNTFHNYIKLLASDTLIYRDSFYVGTGGILNTQLQNIISAYGDSSRVSKFMNTWTGAGTQLLRVTDTPSMLRVVYSDSAEAYMNLVADNMGEAYIDSSIASVPHLDPECYAISVSSALGLGSVPTLYTGGAYVNEYLGETYWLGEHHLYGSSRLGVKQYWKSQLASIFDYTKAPAYIDTIRLNVRVPWYSTEYQDGINFASTTPYGQTYTSPYTTQHSIGLKYYELTDHLGDVLATISDKRNGKDLNGDTIIDVYRASIPTAYDYYPFGMLMPGRYIRDTAEHCAIMTQTMMVPQWVSVSVGVNPGPVNMIGGAVPTWFSPTSVSVFAPAPMFGLSLDMSSLSVNGSSNISYSVTSLTGTWQASVVDSTGNTVASQAVQGPGSFSLDFVPASTTAQFQLVSVNPGGTVRWASPTYKTLTYVAGTVTSLVCNGEKDRYRFGFNGQEKDNEIAGVGNSLDYVKRSYDPRIARFKSVDFIAYKFPMLTPFQFASNSPIQNVDMDGLEGYKVVDYQSKTTTIIVDIFYVPKTSDNSGPGQYNSGFTPKQAKKYAKSIQREYKTGKFVDKSHADEDGKPFKAQLQVKMHELDPKTDRNEAVKIVNEDKEARVLLERAEETSRKLPDGSTETTQGATTTGVTRITDVNDDHTNTHELWHNLTHRHPDAPDDLKNQIDPNNQMPGHKAAGGIFIYADDRDGTKTEHLNQKNVDDALRTVPERSPTSTTVTTPSGTTTTITAP